MWEQVREVGCWNPVFTRQINDWELGEVEELLRRLQQQVIKRGVEDVMVRWLSKGGTFIVKSVYSSLAGCFPKGFPTSTMDSLGADESQFFYLGSNWGKSLTLNQTKNEGLVSSKQMVFV